MASSTGHRGGSAATSERTLQDYLAVIIRGKWTILTVFAVVVGATILYTKLVPPVYKATAQVLLNTKELQPQLFLDAARPDAVKNITQNELAVLNSRTLADTVARRLLEAKYVDASHQQVLPILVTKDAARGDSIATFMEVSGLVSEAVDFDPVRESDIINISAKSKDPREAALIANTFAESYRDRNIWMSRTKTRSFKEFLDQQAKDKRRELDDTEASLQEYMERQGIVSLDDESKNLIEKLSQLEATRDATDIALKEKENQLASYQDQLPQQETNVARSMGEANDPYIRLLQEQIAKLEVQRDVTVAQNPASVGREILNEKVKEIDAQIAALKLKLQKRTDQFLRNLTPAQVGGTQTDAAGYLKSVKQKIIETQIDVQSLQTKKKALEEVLQQYEAQFNRIPKTSLQLARLQRSRTSDEKLYLMLQEKFNEANITEQSNIGYIEIIEPAAEPFKPSSPKFLINLAIGIVFGLGLGLVVVFVKEYVDVRIQSPEEVKRHGYQPLTAILTMDKEIVRLGGQAKSVAGKKALDSHLITFSYPFSAIAESYRQLRTNLQFSKQGAANRVVVVTSPTPGEGKSTTVSNLAIAFAQNGKKVLLVDADLRRPTIDAEFDLKKEPGLTEMLSGKAGAMTVIQRSAVENLHVVCCGGIPPNPAEVLGSEQMREFVDRAKRDYDVILFDSSPVLAVTDPTVLSTLADGVIVVVSAGKTRLDELRQAAELLEGVGGKVLGVVVNNLDLRRAYGIAYRRAGAGNYGYGNRYYGRGRGGDGTAARKADQKAS